MPVYIPHEDGYYNDSFDIFKKSIRSLIHTIDESKVNITIINNGSMDKVDNFIRILIKENKIDQYVQNLQNRGKADSVIGIAKASYEPLITFTDGDVLFEPGWLENIETAFLNEPTTGMICPFPAPQLCYHYTVSSWLKYLPFRIKLKKVVSISDLIFFAKSIGIDSFFNQRDLNAQFHIESKGKNYLLGAGHFVATYKREIFQKMNYDASLMGLKGGLKQIERTVDRLGYCHLSLNTNMVYHMGNKMEDWIEEYYQRIINSPKHQEKTIQLPKNKPSITRFLPEKVFQIIHKLILYFSIGIRKVLNK